MVACTFQVTWQMPQPSLQVILRVISDYRIAVRHVQNAPVVQRLRSGTVPILLGALELVPDPLQQELSDVVAATLELDDILAMSKKSMKPLELQVLVLLPKMYPMVVCHATVKHLVHNAYKRPDVHKTIVVGDVTFESYPSCGEQARTTHRSRLVARTRRLHAHTATPRGCRRTSSSSHRLSSKVRTP